MKTQSSQLSVPLKHHLFCPRGPPNPSAEKAKDGSRASAWPTPWPGNRLGWSPKRNCLIPRAPNMICTGHVVGLCQGAWGGSAEMAGPAEAQQLELKLYFIFRFKRPREYLPWQSFTFLYFYWKLTDLVISKACLCLFFLTNTISLNKNYFPDFCFYYEQLLDTYSIKKSTFDRSSLILSIIQSYPNSLFGIVKGVQGHRGRWYTQHWQHLESALFHCWLCMRWLVSPVPME